ncbi:MAG: rhomboid family intramembrane serine protease [Planctomycetes bacterium]|nr:rhomboid family intramembrane serine protease [Planctomycetota bacterium]
MSQVRGDTRRGIWGFLDRYPFTIGVVAICLSLFVYAGFRSGGWPVDPDLGLLLGANDSAQLAQEPWRLLTCGFLHYEVWHLGFNLIALVYWGRLFEVHFGSARLWVLYCVMLLVASLCSAGWQEAAVAVGVQSAGASSTGASGAVFGLLFLCLITAQQAPGRFGSLLLPLRAWIGLSFLFAFFRAAPTDHAAHLGGSIAGIALGYVCRPEPGENLPAAWAGWAIALALGVVGAFSWILWTLRDYQP